MNQAPWIGLGAMRLPVLAYCAVIGAMVWLALGVPDPLVRPGKVNQLLGWPLCYAGQFLLALSLS